MHWGVGAGAARADYQGQLARTLVDAGATCVLGGHPPALQGLELRERALVSYSQGTFIRQQPRATEDPLLARLYEAMPRSGCLLRLDLEAGDRIRASIVPTVLGERDLAGVVAGREAESVIQEVLRRSALDGAQPTMGDGVLELSVR